VVCLKKSLTEPTTLQMRQPATQDGMVRGEPEGVMTSPDAKPTFHSQSAPGYIDHLKITGGMGTSRQESAVDTVGNH
jgi:hypothetical protein